jgi:hypothetical protein
MTDHEEALETVLGWAGKSPPRELLVAVLTAPIMALRLDDVRYNRTTVDKANEHLERDIEINIAWADWIIKRCKVTPPKV